MMIATKLFALNNGDRFIRDATEEVWVRVKKAPKMGFYLVESLDGKKETMQCNASVYLIEED